MVSIGSLVIIAATVALSNGGGIRKLPGSEAAFSISKFENISQGLGVYDEWAKNPDNIREDKGYFGLVFGGDKLYLVTRRPVEGFPKDGSAVRGGMVSILVNGSWIHKPYDRLAEDKYDEKLFSLGGRLHMLAYSTADNITFHKLFTFDEEQGKWNEIALNVDPEATQALPRGPRYVVSHLVPDPEGNMVYLLATDHDTNKVDSESTLSKLEVLPEGANIKLVKKISGEKAKAATSMAFKDERVYMMVSNFEPPQKDPIVAPVSIDYYIDLKSGERVELAKMDNATKPIIDFSHDRSFQLGNDILFLEPPVKVEPNVVHKRRLDLVNIDSRSGQQTDGEFPGEFPLVPKYVFTVDPKTLKIYTAGLKEGASVATITP